MSAAAEALGQINDELGRPSLEGREAAGLCHSCCHSVNNRAWDHRNGRRIGPDLICGRDYEVIPHRAGRVPDGVRSCAAYEYEPGAAG